MHTVEWAALNGETLISAWDLYGYLNVHGVGIMSKTAHALHSSEWRQLHDLIQRSFLNYHPIDLKIDRINCSQSFANTKTNPMVLFSRNTSCFCEGYKFGNFQAFVDVLFHGTWHTYNVLNIMPVVCISDDIHLAVTMRAHLLVLTTSFPQPYLVIINEHKSIVRPTYAL